MPNESPVQLSKKELDDLLDRAAQRGAERALDGLGLSDDLQTRHDLYEIRELLKDWRAVKRGAMHFIGKIIGVSILGALAFFVTGRYWGE